MQTPLCQKCAWSESLCPSCDAKRGSGEMSDLDIEVSRILHKINELHNITAAQFSHAIDLGDAVLVFTPGEAGLLIGRGGKVVSALSAALGKRVRVVSERGDARKSLEDLITPAKILGINESFHAGSTRLSIRLAKSDEKLLRIDVRKLEPLVAKWMGKPVVFVFE